MLRKTPPPPHSPKKEFKIQNNLIKFCWVIKALDTIFILLSVTAQNLIMLRYKIELNSHRNNYIYIYIYTSRSKNFELPSPRWLDPLLEQQDAKKWSVPTVSHVEFSEFSDDAELSGVTTVKRRVLSWAEDFDNCGSPKQAFLLLPTAAISTAFSMGRYPLLIRRTSSKHLPTRIHRNLSCNSD